jgi:hypothetical protein
MSEIAVRKVGGWCEMAASLRELKSGKRERPLLEDVTKQGSEDLNWEHWSVCDSDLKSVVTSYALKCPTNPSSNQNPVYSTQPSENIFNF